ncbi:hypothetical protein [Oerskovia sp. USHLN155]|uniref:hypothetical protein n=1 Tax=Oerskovia sp. USHLN155 TaxID=3081288 RepID=UPI003017DB32
MTPGSPPALPPIPPPNDDTNREDDMPDEQHDDHAGHGHEHPADGHDGASHGTEPLGPVDDAPIHAAVDALAAALHEYVGTAVGVRTEFGASEADEDPRVLALEAAIGALNAQLYDALHDSLGMHPDLSSLVWGAEEDLGTGADADAPPAPEVAEPFYLGFVVGPGQTPDTSLDAVIDFLDNAGEQVVAALVESGFDVPEWAASRGEAADFDGYGDADDEAPEAER